MTEPLKPCPFCGQAVTMTFEGGNDVRDARVFVSCADCQIAFSETAEDWGPRKGTVSVRDKAERKLAKRWNRRAT